MLRVVKEEAEKPEKEAKDQHQKLWEGMSRGGHYLSLAPGPVRSGDFLLIVICFLSNLDHDAQFFMCLVILDCVFVIVFDVICRNNLQPRRREEGLFFLSAIWEH